MNILLMKENLTYFFHLLLLGTTEAISLVVLSRIGREKNVLDIVIIQPKCPVR